MDVIQYKCPNCGGDLKFNPATGSFTCEYCRSQFSQDDIDRQTASKENQTSGQTAPAAASDELEDTKVYTCPSCGATIVTDATTAATFCYYCHNPVVLSGRLDGEYKPDYVVPFAIDRKKATEIFENWIKTKKYVPKAFYSKDQIDKLTGVYFPYLLYTCNITGKIKGRATKRNVYTRGNVEYTETGTYEIERDGNMEVKNVLRNALKKANNVLAEGVLPFNTEDMKPFNMGYLSGFLAEKRDLGKDDFEEEVKTEVKGYAMEQLRNSVAGYDGIQITSDNTELVNEKWEYALMPVWTLTYNDNGKIYYFSINGQSGKTIGELPVDKNKLIRSFFMIFIPILAVLLLVFYFIL